MGGKDDDALNQSSIQILSQPVSWFFTGAVLWSRLHGQCIVEAHGGGCQEDSQGGRRDFVCTDIAGI